jgi:hypothetical protein
MFDPVVDRGDFFHDLRQYMARMFPNHQMDTVKGAGHFPPTYAREFFTSMIQLRWKDKIDPRPELTTN